MAWVGTSPSQTKAEAYSATPMRAETVTAAVALASARNATWPVTNALTTMNGAAMVIAASSFGTTICHRGMGARVRFASVRSSISLANAAVAMASTTSGAMEPASMPLNTMVSNSATEGADEDRTTSMATSTGSDASTVMIRSRHRPTIWPRVRR